MTVQPGAHIDSGLAAGLLPESFLGSLRARIRLLLSPCSCLLCRLPQYRPPLHSATQRKVKGFEGVIKRLRACI